MNSTRPSRTKANQINYAELLTDESELTELDDDDVSPGRAGPSTSTRGRRRKEVTTASFTEKHNKRSGRAVQGKQKVAEKKSPVPKDEDVDMDAQESSRGKYNRLLTSSASPLVYHDIHVSFQYYLSQLYQVF